MRDQHYEEKLAHIDKIIKEVSQSLHVY